MSCKLIDVVKDLTTHHSVHSSDLHKCLPTWADISVSVSVAILWVFGYFEGALMGLISNFLDRAKTEIKNTKHQNVNRKFK